MITRIIVAAIFGPMILVICYLGGWWLMGMILFFALIGAIEFMINEGFKGSPMLFGVTIFYIVCLILASTLISFSVTFIILLSYFLLAGMLLGTRREPPALLFQQMMKLLWITIYIGMLYPFLYHIRDLSHSGGDWLLFLFGTLWLSDSLAMWIGGAIGKRKLAPTVSPGKTVAGFLAGLCGGVIVAIILGWWRLSEYFLPLLIIGGLLVSFTGQLGDLVESMWKRSIGIKDSSNIIPGHGGVLDRFDSMLFASPVLFLYLKYFIYG
jgi:phosphatidate cytidylyltransferase